MLQGQPEEVSHLMVIHAANDGGDEDHPHAGVSGRLQHGQLGVEECLPADALEDAVLPTVDRIAETVRRSLQS